MSRWLRLLWGRGHHSPEPDSFPTEMSPEYLRGGDADSGRNQTPTEPVMTQRGAGEFGSPLTSGPVQTYWAGEEDGERWELRIVPDSDGEKRTISLSGSYSYGGVTTSFDADPSPAQSRAMATALQVRADEADPQPQPESDSGAPDELRSSELFTINGHGFPVPSTVISSEDLRSLPIPPLGEDVELYRSTWGGLDPMVSQGEQLTVAAGDAFYSVPKNITAGSESDSGGEGGWPDIWVQRGDPLNPETWAIWGSAENPEVVPYEIDGCRRYTPTPTQTNQTSGPRSERPGDAASTSPASCLTPDRGAAEDSRRSGPDTPPNQGEQATQLASEGEDASKRSESCPEGEQVERYRFQGGCGEHEENGLMLLNARRCDDGEWVRFSEHQEEVERLEARMRRLDRSISEAEEERDAIKMDTRVRILVAKDRKILELETIIRDVEARASKAEKRANRAEALIDEAVKEFDGRARVKGEEFAKGGLPNDLAASLAAQGAYKGAADFLRSKLSSEAGEGEKAQICHGCDTWGPREPHLLGSQAGPYDKGPKPCQRCVAYAMAQQVSAGGCPDCREEGLGSDLEKLAKELEETAEKYQRERAKCKQAEADDHASGKLPAGHTYEATWNYYEGLAVGAERAARSVREVISASPSTPGDKEGGS